MQPKAVQRKMISKSSLQHLRFPFSIKLLPIFIFGLTQVPDPFHWNTITLFILLHLIFYPASNGYNSYWDRDKEAIAGVESPLPVTEDLYWISMGLDVIGFTVSIFVLNSPLVVLLLFLCAVLSRAYSHPRIRLKKYPILSWIIVGTFQGYVICICTIIMGQGAGAEQSLTPRHHWAAILTTLLLWTVYPITQVYQHGEDSRRGDLTLSILMGIKGTFIFTGIMSLVLFSSFILFFYAYYKSQYFLMLVGVFVACELPFIMTFLQFAQLAVLIDPKYADFKGTMKLTIVSSISTNVYFLWLLSFSYVNDWNCFN